MKDGQDVETERCGELESWQNQDARHEIAVLGK